MTRPVVQSLALAAALVGAAVGSEACKDTGSPITPPPTAPNPNKVQIGMVLSLSGAAGSVGAEAKRGAEVAVAQLNSIGGVLGKQIELVVVDDQSNPATTVQKATELAAQGVVAGIGPSTSSAALALSGLIKSDKVLYVSPSATSSEIDSPDGGIPTPEPPGATYPNPVLFRTAPSDTLLATAIAQYASGTVGATSARRCPSIIVVSQKDAYGTPIATAIERRYILLSLLVSTKKLELDPNIGNTQSLDDAANAVGTAAGRGRDVGDIACQVVVAQPAVAGAYMRAFSRYTAGHAAQRDWSAFLTIGSDGFRQNEFIAAGRSDPANPSLPTAGESAYAIAADTAPDEALRTPEFSFFLNEFQARFPGVDPGRYGSTAYDATLLLAGAIERAKSATNLPAIRNAMFKISFGQQLVRPQALSAMFDLLRKGEDINYEGASGSLDFQTADSPGDVLADFGIWKIVKGSFEREDTFKASQLQGSAQ